MVRLCDRPSLLCPPQRVFDAVTSDTIIKEITSVDGHLQVSKLEYNIPREDARCSVVVAKGRSHVLWKAGLTAAVPMRPPKKPSMLDGLPTCQPEDEVQRRHLRPPLKRPNIGVAGRGAGLARAGHGSAARGGGARPRMLADATAGGVQDSTDEADDQLRREFVREVCGGSRGEADGEMQEIVEANTPAFAEMYLASLDGKASDNIDVILSPEKDDDSSEGATKHSDIEKMMLAVGAPDGVDDDVLVSGCQYSAEVVQVGGASSSSSGGPSVLRELHPSSPVPQMSATAQVPPASSTDEMQDVVEFDGLDKGGLVKRGGEAIGRISALKNGSHGVRCYMHSCSLVISKKVPVDDCVRWLAEGVKRPPMCTVKELADLKAQHMKAKRPSVPPPLPP